MNTVLIVFLVLVIIVSIYFAVQVFNPSYLIRDSVSLNIMPENSTTSAVQHEIAIKRIDNPGSNRYFYEGWFYIKENAPIKTANVLFNRGDDFVVVLTGSTLNVYVNTKVGDSQSKISSAGVLDTSGLDDKSLVASIPNFPFQKWCQLVINVDGMVLDLYIDGKFVKNAKRNSPIGTDKTTPITYGNQYTVGNVTRFRRPATSINPQGVWSSYMQGSGQNYSLTNYHVNAQLTKNKDIRVDQRLI